MPAYGVLLCVFYAFAPCAKLNANLCLDFGQARKMVKPTTEPRPQCLSVCVCVQLWVVASTTAAAVKLQKFFTLSIKYLCLHLV